MDPFKPETTSNKDAKILMTGIRPTGRLHLGNYFSVVKHLLELQEKPDDYNCFLMIADLHALISGLTPEEIRENTIQLVVDLMALDIDPERVKIYRQSDVSGVTYLASILSNLVSVARMNRVPAFKEAMENDDPTMFGFMGYPVMQAADILIMNAEVVPVGPDQAPHIELTRELARKFNSTYGDVFEIPERLDVTSFIVPGTDRRKMSKQFDNCIYVFDSEEETTKKVNSAMTDEKKIHKGDAGDIKKCAVYGYYLAFDRICSDGQPLWAIVEQGCKDGTRGCAECKEACATMINSEFAPHRANRDDSDNMDSILAMAAGAEIAHYHISPIMDKVAKHVL